MNTSDQNHDSPPWASLLYSPVRVSNIQSSPKASLPGESLTQSYIRQWYRFSHEGFHYALRPTSSLTNPYNHLWPQPVGLDHPVRKQLRGFVMGYWHPEGTPSTSEGRAEQKALMQRVVRDQGLDVFMLTTFQRESQWVEPAVLVRGVSQEHAGEIARELGQKALVEITETRVLASLVDGHLPLGGYQWELHLLPEAPCPLSVGYEVINVPARAGGPWVSRSREVAALWQNHYALTHSLADCAACNKVQDAKPRGKAIALGGVLPASRYKYSYVAGYEDDAIPGLAWNGGLTNLPGFDS
jgi:hypothetical protein